MKYFAEDYLKQSQEIISKQTFRIMRLTALLLVVCFLQVSASGFSQKVSFDKRNVTLEEILIDINKQTGFSYSVGSQVLQKAKPITVKLKSVTLTQALDACFQNQNLIYSIVDKIIIIKEKTSQVNVSVEQNQIIIDVVKGRLVKENGEPVSATVAVKGTSIGTNTDSDGAFVLRNVDENAVLIISGINIEPFEVLVKGRTDLDVIVAKTRIVSGSEVVVEANTGYQTIKPNETNGSVTVVDNERLNQQVGVNILNRLDGTGSATYLNIGKFGNGNPQNRTNISIRGLSTINGPLDPLIVLDNFIYEGDINNINPNDIESITILKDAAATSIYGARGGNGVIVITSKKGAFNQKMKVEFNTNFIHAGQPDLFAIREISTSDFIDVEQFLFNKQYRLDDTLDIRYPSFTPAYEIFLKRLNGQISAGDSASQIDYLKSIDSRNEYLKHFYRNSLTQQYSLNLRGGTENISWIIAGGYDRSVSDRHVQNNKINFRSNNLYKPFKNLQINLGVFYTNNKTSSNQNGSPDYNSITVNNKRIPYLLVEDADGNAVPVSNIYRDVYTDTVGSGKLLDWRYFPLDDYKNNETTIKREEIVANLGINYEIVKGLSIDFLYQYHRQRTSVEDLSNIESFNARDLINRFTQINQSTGLATYPIPVGGILRMNATDLNSQNGRGQLNFNRTFGKHHISAIGGAEVRQVSSSGNSSTVYGYQKDPLSFGSVDFRNVYFVIPDGSATIPGQPFVFPKSVSRFASIYGNAVYLYNQKYSVNLSARKDGSNVFGANTNDKWKPQWSAGMGWTVSKEGFYSVKWLEYLKIRATIGYSGNVDLNKTALPIAAYSSNAITNLPTTRVQFLNDPSLRWEQVRQINFGLDFSILRNVLSGSVDYYRKEGTDLYGISPFDYTGGAVGGQTITKNVANMEGEGLDAVLNFKNTGQIVKWQLTALFNYNINKTTKYFGESSGRVSSLLSGGSSIFPVVGKPLYAIAAYRWGGLNSSGDPQGYLNGELSTDYQAISTEGSAKGETGNIKYIGPANPKIFGSIINEISWKGFAASCNVSYRFGYYFIKPTLSYSNLYDLGIGTEDFKQRWRQPGDESFTNVPSMVFTDYPQFFGRDEFYSQSEINVLKAGNIRLQYINLSYSFQLKNRKINVERVQLYVNVANLGIIWRANDEKYDPDYPGTFSPSKQFAFGIRASL